jgi:bacillithiol biosynthesis deacetylase BshB1
MAMTLDVLAFGPHPDDIEIGVGGTVAVHAAAGYRVGLCDLTRGELGTNGTPATRMAEAETARKVLGAVVRVNLGWPDGAIGRSRDHERQAASLIRRYRPGTVLVPWREDRHPDHRAACDVLTRAVFASGLRRYKAEGDPWRPDWCCYYFINDSTDASFLIDVSEGYETKRAALACHRSQFRPTGRGAVSTRLTSARFQQLVESRDAQFGARIGVAFAEGFIVPEPVVRPHVLRDWTARRRRRETP